MPGSNFFLETLHEATDYRILRQANLTQTPVLPALTTMTNVIGGRTLVAVVTQLLIFVSHIAQT